MDAETFNDLIQLVLFIQTLGSIGSILYIIWDAWENKKKAILPFILASFSLAAAITSIVVYTKSYNAPEKEYKRLKDNAFEAEKALEKFYIDHPDFKENK